MSLQLYYSEFCDNEFAYGCCVFLVIVCDACGESIRDAGSGMCLCSQDPFKLVFAHKGDCHTQLERTRENQGDQGCWSELRSLLAHLRNNTPFLDLTDKEFEER